MATSLPTLGFIGTGIMGSSMVGHLLTAGYSIHLFNRTRSKAVPLLEKGAVWADSPAETAARSDVILTIVGYPQDVREIYLGKNGILSTLPKGGLTIDLTTSSPSLAREIYSAAAPKGISSLDAPVTGGDIGAREARLSIMVGGDTEAFQKARPILEKLGKTIIHQGPAGSGQHCKLANQTVIAGTMIGLVEGLIYARKAGLNLETALSTLSQGSAASFTMNSYAPRILKKDFEPGFMVEHFVKDMDLVLQESHRMGIELPGLALVRKLYEKIMEKGLKRKGTQALVLALSEDF